MPTGAVRTRSTSRSLRVASLFSGIGGLEVGLAAAGHEPIRFCEVDVAARAVLRHRFPGIRADGDIRDLDTLPNRSQLVAAGFPCQDLSQVGQASGFSGVHSSLVSHVFDLLKEKQTPWVLLENVPFMLYLEKGRTLRNIVSWLERLGYFWAYRIVDNRAFGRPQRRRRVFLLAALKGDPREVLLADDAEPITDPTVRNGEACGFYWTEGNKGTGWTVDAIPPLKGGSLVGIPSPPAFVLPGAGVFTPDIRDAERLQGFPANWSKAADRVDGSRRPTRWRLVGNAVSVDVARWIGRRLRSPRLYDDTNDVKLHRNAPWPSAAWNIGEGRFKSNVTEWPVCYRRRSLADFLQYEPKLLSKRATEGFLNRLLASNLTLDRRFVSELRQHLKSMNGNP